jgi:diguanylate cyclase (GGDEF)-like protein
MNQDTPLEQQNEELKSALSLLTATLDSTADGILVVGADHKISLYNQRFVEMWRIPPEILSSRDDSLALAFVLGQLQDPASFLARVDELYGQPEAESFDTLAFKDGRTFERYSRPQRMGGKAAGRVWSFRDVTEREQAAARLLHDAFHDELTGLPNRALFLDRLRQALERARREPDQLTAVLFLDLDRFKLVNDRLGHMVGDQVLTRISATLGAVLRPADTIARIGGDEFAVLLEGGRDVSDAVRVAERLHASLSAPIRIGKHQHFVTMSIGIAIRTPEHKHPEALLRDADTAMYRAKSSGRACYVVFNRAMHRQVMARRRLEADLRRALEEDQFRIHYQPFVDLATDEVVGFEALVRWQHPKRGLRPPADFLAEAEQTGLLVAIGRHVLTESCRQISDLQRRFPRRRPLKLTVNLSNNQFFHVDLFDQIGEALATSGLDPLCLGLEITEGVVIDHPESATGRFSRLKDMGVQLYLDDFGKGYSSLSYLHLFPMEILKIDRSFTARIAKTERNLAIVRAIVTLAQQLEMKVVAEGIETAQQLDTLRDLGCEYGQGYRFSKPIPADGLDALLRRNEGTSEYGGGPGLAEVGN